MLMKSTNANLQVDGASLNNFCNFQNPQSNIQRSNLGELMLNKDVIGSPDRFQATNLQMSQFQQQYGDLSALSGQQTGQLR
mmetsp:Transcript_42682/g.65483  ORF Transcript_42682/g.65483 Transcript_42682/m.65483 type:complete len:81 (-) Transcript_42682:60-302(-)